MKSLAKKLAALAAAALLAASFAPSAFAGPLDTAKCNSGNGNGSGTVPESDCDPGNSGGHNNGGD
jgi:hypothetical protein